MSEPTYFQALITDGRWFMYTWIGRRSPLPKGWTIVQKWSLRLPESYFFPEEKR